MRVGRKGVADSIDSQVELFSQSNSHNNLNSGTLSPNIPGTKILPGRVNLEGRVNSHVEALGMTPRLHQQNS